MNQRQKCFGYQFSAPVQLTDENIKSIPNKLFGVFIIYRFENAMPESAMTVGSGILYEVLAQFLNTHKNMTYWFTHHPCKREQAKVIREDVSIEINLVRRH